MVINKLLTHINSEYIPLVVIFPFLIQTFLEMHVGVGTKTMVGCHNLFVNICSFQEMEIKEIKKYFDIIKSNRAFFYCCNREYKQLPGGENIYFKDYPWGDGKKIFIEDCTWCQNLYSFRPPFVYKYDGNIKHALIDYS